MQEIQFEKPGFYFQWHFIEACNLRCKHCYQKKYIAQKMDIGLVLQTVSQIERALLAWEMTGRVSITGGEPLLDLDTLGFILDRLSNVEKINHLGILTNGTLITKETIWMFKRYSKLKEVQVSLDGATPSIHDQIRGDGNFEKAIRGLRMLVSSGIPATVMFTASQINAQDVVDVIKLADKIGIYAITIERYTPSGGNKDPLALTAESTRRIFEAVLEIKTQLGKKGRPLKIRTSRPLWNLLSPNEGGVCPVGYSCLTIMHDGVVYPCRRLPISLGTIQNDGLFKIWYTSSILWGLRKRQSVEECSTCDQNTLCGGCRAAAYESSGNYMGKDPLCWKNRKEVDL